MNTSPSFPTSSWKNWFSSLYALIRPNESVPKPPVEHRQAELVAGLSLTLAVIALLGGLTTAALTGLDLRMVPILITSLSAFVAYFLSRNYRTQTAQIVLVANLTVQFFVLPSLVLYPTLVLILVASVIFSFASLFTLRQQIFVVLFLTISLFVLRRIMLPGLDAQEINLLIMGLIATGAFQTFFTWHHQALERLRMNELLQTQAALEKFNQELQTAQEKLQERLQEIQLAAQVGRVVSQVRSLNVMLTDAVELIRARFNLYYVQIYLVNPAQTHLVLQSGTGEAGLTLLARKHQLALNTGSINGRAAVERKPVVISDTANSAVFKPNPLLPQTRSEMAVPLIVSERVVGVLDVQSDQVGFLNEEILPAFEALAGQLAIAIQNARQFQIAQKAATEAEEAYRRYIRGEWRILTRETKRLGYRYSKAGVGPLKARIDSSEVAEAATTGKTNTSKKESRSQIVVPIKLREEVIGILNVSSELTQQWDQDDIDIAEAVAERVALAIENVRLVEASQAQAARERTISEVTSRIGDSINLNSILQTAVEELGRIIPGSEVIIQLGKEDEK